MNKRILNIATFARRYFEQLGKLYDENDRKQRESADKNFRRIINKNQLKLDVFEKVRVAYLEQVDSEISELTKPPKP